MGKEALIAVCALIATAVTATELAEEDPQAGPGAKAADRAAFAGGPEGGDVKAGARERGEGGAGGRGEGGAGGRARRGVGPYGGDGPGSRGGRGVGGDSLRGREAVAVRRGRSVLLHDRPGGHARYILRERTPFGSPTVLPVVRRRAGWLGVLSSALPNGRVGWIRDDRRSLAPRGTPVRVIVDRSARRLTLVRGGRALLTTQVGVGRPGSETPTGTFAVTDKLDGSRYARGYGCCILALTGRQSRLPAGWRGGDRLAIHGTDGRGSTAGCVAAPDASLRRLMRSVPLGTIVTIRP